MPCSRPLTAEGALVNGLGAIAAASVSLVFVAAGLGKLANIHSFVRALRSQGLRSRRLRRVAAIAIPASELGCAIALWVPVSRRPAAVIGALMLGAFTIVLVRSIVTGLTADCGCFGSRTRDRVSWVSVARNVVLIALALIAAVPEPDGVGPAGALLAGFGIGMVVLVGDAAAAALGRNWVRSSSLESG
jgi:uncharacterized membrane protein YphA (DoxX/SURF4 family)